MTARTLLPLDPDLVGPWALGSGRRGALLLHGFAGTPPELRGLGEHLSANGWRCVAPALAGHAATPEEMASTCWREWAASARDALDALSAECDEVVVAGQSMGGTLALHLAATDLRIAAVAALATPIWIRSSAPFTLPFLKYFYRWHVARGPVDLFRLDGIEDLYSYGRRPTRSIHELFRLLRNVAGEISAIRAPVLLLNGARDGTVDPRNAVDIGRRLVASRAVGRHLYARSGHALSVDVDAPDVNRRVLEWFDRFVPGDPTPHQSGQAQPASARHSPHD